MKYLGQIELSGVVDAEELLKALERGDKKYSSSIRQFRIISQTRNGYELPIIAIFWYSK